MIRKQDVVYETPPGFEDQHFIYVFDAGGLTDGLDYQNLMVQMQGDGDFILRKIDGINTVLGVGVAGVVGRWQLKNAKGDEASSVPIYSGSAMFRNDSWAVVPEKSYNRYGVIPFDLYAILRNQYPGTGPPPFLVPATVPASQFLFWGVKRKPVPVAKPEYRYELRPYSYTLNVTINWDVFVYDALGNPVGLAAPRQFYIDVLNHDFELWGVDDTGTGGPLPPTRARIMLYDQTGAQRSSAPVLTDWWMHNSPFSAGNIISPSILYEQGSQIKFDLYSMMYQTDLDFPITRQWTFFGVQRVRV